MKLYATTTSDRASKGQGGNKHLSVELLADTINGRELVGIATMEVQGDTIKLVSTIPSEREYKIK